MRVGVPPAASVFAQINPGLRGLSIRLIGVFTLPKAELVNKYWQSGIAPSPVRWLRYCSHPADFPKVGCKYCAELNFVATARLPSAPAAGINRFPYAGIRHLRPFHVRRFYEQANLRRAHDSARSKL